MRAITEVGDVEIEIADSSFMRDGSIVVEVGHGKIHLELPSNTRINVLASIWESGTIYADQDGWSIEVINERSSPRRDEVHRAEFEIGGGGGEIDLSVRFGDIIIDNQF